MVRHLVSAGVNKALLTLIIAISPLKVVAIDYHFSPCIWTKNSVLILLALSLSLSERDEQRESTWNEKRHTCDWFIILLQILSGVGRAAFGGGGGVVNNDFG